MMAALIDAAEKAAAACDQVQTIVVGLRGNGFVVMGRIETPLLGYTHELSVPYATVDIEPTALPFAVERMAQALEERRSEIPTFMIDSAEQPPVRVIERSDWSFWDKAVRAVAVLALIVCLPLASRILP
jgi:hypothetical protein